MWYVIGIYVIIVSLANLALVVFLYVDRYRAFKKEGEQTATVLMKEHIQALKMDEQAILDDFRNSISTVISSTELSGQQMLEKMNDYLIHAHTENQQRYNAFSAKLYQVLVDSGNHFSQQLGQYVQDANKRVDDWQHSYIELMKTEIDSIISAERAKLATFTEEEQKRIQVYMQQSVTRELSIIAEEVLSSSISLKDQEKLATQAVEKFFQNV